MNYFKRIIITTFIITAIGAQYPLHAGISPLAFKNVGKCFKSGFEYYAPMFGSVALTTGLIENLRFYNVEAKYKDESREYISDKSPINDYVMQAIIILFPSPAGQLTAETTHSTSFGRKCTEEDCSTLLNFAYLIRKHCKSGHYKKFPTESKELTQILQQAHFANDFLQKNFPQSKFKDTPKEELLFAIAKVIEHEEHPQPATIAEFYPKYFIEQVINAFFCHKFADQEAIKKMLNSLNDELIDKSKIASIDGLLKKEDVTSALGNIEKKSFTFDDLWLGLNKDLPGRAIPYENNREPISNAAAQMFKRDERQGRFDPKRTFADCVEVSLRHICNCFLYDQAEQKFNLTHLKLHMSGKPDTYVKQVYNFYENIQSPDKANAGNIVIRSAWNAVVADLNALEKNKVRYRQKYDNKNDTENNNELDTGMFNIMRIFKTIFSLKLAEEPLYQPDEEKYFKQIGTQWIEEGLKQLVNVLNPNLRLDIACSHIEIDSSCKDLLGDIDCEIKDKNGKKLFAFTIHVMSGHVYMGKIDLGKKSERLSNKVSTNILLHLASKNPINTTFDSFQLLYTLGNSKTPLVRLFRRSVNDHHSIIDALRNMHRLLTDKHLNPERAALILRNLLRSFPWDDEFANLFVKEVIINLKNYASNSSSNEIMHTLQQEVRSCKFEDDIELQEWLISFPGIVNLFSSAETLSTLNLKEYTTLKKISLGRSSVENINFPSHMDNLEELDLPTSIRKLSLPACPALKKINLEKTINLESITFDSEMKSLKELNLADSGIKILHLRACPSLKKINMPNTKRLEKIIFGSDLNSLEYLNLNDSGIKTLRLPSCSALKDIDLNSAINLETFIFDSDMDSLENLNLSYTKIKMLNIPACPLLRDIRLNHTENLETITFKSNMNNLKVLSLQLSGIKILNLLNCIALKNIYLEGTKNLETINFPSNMKNLEKLDLSYSGIKILQLPECPELKLISLYVTKNLETINFPSRFDKLEALYFSESPIKTLNLPECPMLEKIYAEDSNLQKIISSKYWPKIEILSTITLEESNPLNSKLTILQEALDELKKKLGELAQKLGVLAGKLAH